MNIVHVSKVKVHPTLKMGFYCASDEAVDALLAQLEEIGCKWGSSHKPTEYRPKQKPPYIIDVGSQARITWRSPLSIEPLTFTRRVVL